MNAEGRTGDGDDKTTALPADLIGWKPTTLLPLQTQHLQWQLCRIGHTCSRCVDVSERERGSHSTNSGK